MPNDFSENEQAVFSTLLKTMKRNPTISILFMETLYPLQRIVHSFLTISSPLASVVVDRGFVDVLTGLSSRSDAWDYLIQQLDS